MKLTEEKLKQMILESMQRSKNYEKLKSLMMTKEGLLQAESLYEMLRDTFDDEEQMHMDILFAQDGTNYSAMSRAVASVSAAGYYSQPITTLIVDVTDASVCKLKFKVNYAHASTSVRGDGSGSDYSWFDFIRLADT